MDKFSKKQLNIIDLSLDIILNEGIQSLTIKNLSGRAGVTEPAIYRHFKSKFEILYSLLDFFDSQTEILVKKISEDPSVGLDKLKLFFLTLCTRFNRHKAFAIIMFSEEIFVNNVDLKEKLLIIIQKQRTMLMSIIENSQKNNLLTSNIPSEHIFTIIVGSLRFLVTQWKMQNFEKNLENIGSSYWKSLEEVLSLRND